MKSSNFSELRRELKIMGIKPRKLREENYSGIVLFICLIASLILIMTCCDHAHANETSWITDKQAVQCIMGEARNQGRHGMQAVAYALNNRHTIKGVYGCSVKNINEPQYVWNKARVSWIAAINNPQDDFTHGAKSWENVNAFGLPVWAKKIHVTYIYKDHVFYKEKK